MRPTSPLATGALLCGALLIAAIEVGQQLGAARPTAAIGTGAAEWSEWSAALLALAAIAAVGRVALALLPPGTLGSHRPQELAATWAASHLVGAAILGAERAWADRLGLALSPAIALGPWALIAALRFATLPAALRPRHDLERGGAALASRLARAALAVALALPLLSIGLGRGSEAAPGLPSLFGRASTASLASLLADSTGPNAADGARQAVLSAASWIATALLVAHALAEARRPPLARALAALLLALAPFGVASASAARGPAHAALFFGAGAALLVPWLHRADRRALCVAAIATAATALEGPPGLALALAGALAIALVAPKPSRGRALLAVALALALVAFPALDGGAVVRWRTAPETATGLASAAALPRDWGAGWLCALAALTVTCARRIVWRSRPAAARLALREPMALWLACGAGLAALAVALPPGAPSAPALLALWPAAVTAAALAFANPARA